jgi:molecular chaperone DnaK
LISKTFDVVKLALRDAGIQFAQVNKVILVGSMTRMPAIQSTIEKYFYIKPSKRVNPEEAVALGAAIQAGVLGGEINDLLLLDVTPLTLSLETLGGVATPLIERNTNIPTRKSQIFSTASDMQSEVPIHVVQGERPMAADNKSLGRFTLDGIPPVPRGIPQIEVTFDIDANGVLKVTAQDKSTRRSQHITIKASSGLSDKDVERMTSEATLRAGKEKERQHEISLRYDAQKVLLNAEQMLNMKEGSLTAASMDDLRIDMDDLQCELQASRIDKIQSSTNKLIQTMQKIERIIIAAEEPPHPPDT